MNHILDHNASKEDLYDALVQERHPYDILRQEYQAHSEHYRALAHIIGSEHKFSAALTQTTCFFLGNEIFINRPIILNRDLLEKHAEKEVGLTRSFTFFTLNNLVFNFHSRSFKKVAEIGFFHQPVRNYLSQQFYIDNIVPSVLAVSGEFIAALQSQNLQQQFLDCFPDIVAACNHDYLHALTHILRSPENMHFDVKHLSLTQQFGQQKIAYVPEESWVLTTHMQIFSYLREQANNPYINKFKQSVQECATIIKALSSDARTQKWGIALQTYMLDNLAKMIKRSELETQPVEHWPDLLLTAQLQEPASLLLHGQTASAREIFINEYQSVLRFLDVHNPDTVSTQAKEIISLAQLIKENKALDDQDLKHMGIYLRTFWHHVASQSNFVQQIQKQSTPSSSQTNVATDNLMRMVRCL